MNNQSAVKDLEIKQLSGRTKVLALDYKVAAILCYTPVLLLSVIAPIVLLKTEPQANRSLRFHAIQGLLLSLCAIAFSVLNSVLSALMFTVLGFAALHLMSLGSSLVMLAFLAYAIYGIYSVYNDKEFRIPFICELADKNA